MEPFTLAWAAQSMGGQITGGPRDPNALVTSVCVDSRQAGPGALFFALQGEKSDGHAYVTQALQAGAVGAVVSHVVDAPADTQNSGAITTEKIGNGRTNESTWEEVEGAQIVVPAPLRALGDLARRYRRQFAIPIVGVTGSVGKTSTKEMIAQVLRTTYHTLASDKNYNNEIGVPLTLLGLDKTHQAAVVEMGMRGLGQIDYLAEIAEPTIGVITNIGHAHMELLGSRENIARAKAEIFARLPAGGAAILHHPEPYWKLLQSQIPPGCRKITYAMSKGYDTNLWYASHKIKLNKTGAAEFRVRVREMTHSLPVKLKAVGEHHIHNALSALCVAYALEVPMEKAVRALKTWEGAPGRMTIRHAPDDVTVLDDCYNASPESMESALHTLFRLNHDGVAILGDMKELGDYAPEAHRRLGMKFYTASCRLLITVGELAEIIGVEGNRFRQLWEQTKRPTVHFATAQDAAAHINDLVQSHDTVLVKGSRAMGMEVIVDALMARTNDALNGEAHA